MHLLVRQFGSGRSVAWLARLFRVQEVVSSNLTAPTIFSFVQFPSSLSSVDDLGLSAYTDRAEGWNQKPCLARKYTAAISPKQISDMPRIEPTK